MLFILFAKRLSLEYLQLINPNQFNLFILPMLI